MLKMLFASAIERLAPYTWAFKLAFYAVLLGGGAYSGYIYRDYSALKEKQADMNTAAIEKAHTDAVLYDISNDLEQIRMQRREWGTQIETRIEHVVEKPSYDGACLDDDGVSAVNAALAGVLDDPSQLDTGMPAVEATKRRQQKSGNTQTR